MRHTQKAKDIYTKYVVSADLIFFWQRLYHIAGRSVISQYFVSKMEQERDDQSIKRNKMPEKWPRHSTGETLCY